MASKFESERLSRFWHEQISQWEETGQSRREYCQAHQLNYHQFGYWYQKFQNDAKEASVPMASSFVTVQRQEMMAAEGLTVILCSGVKIQGITSSNLSLLEQMVSCLS